MRVGTELTRVGEWHVKIAVIQHRLSGTVDGDIEALQRAAATAGICGAEVVFMPEPLSLMGDGAATDRFFAGLDGLPGVRLIPSTAPGVNSFAATAPPLDGLEGLGRIALLAGDACMTGLELVRILGDSPNVAVLAPRSENDLQAEAVMELAIGLSESLASLVVVTECAGAEPGDVGHGGSAIIYLGKVLAEAMGQDEETLYAEIELPLGRPEPPEPMPKIAGILSQRVAHHRGEQAPTDYPAELT
jgi:hypothetical protein